MMLSVTFASDALTTDRVTLHCIIGGIHKVTSGFCHARHWLEPAEKTLSPRVSGLQGKGSDCLLSIAVTLSSGVQSTVRY